MILSTFSLLALVSFVNAYWLMGLGFIATERLDPIVAPGKVSGHVHSIVGGSNFGFEATTALLRQSQCTSSPISQDKSNYWFPQLYFQWANGSFTSVNGGAVIYYLFSNTPGTTKAFPDDFRMLSGDPTLRTYNASSFAQQAVTFLCLDFSGVSTRFNELPNQACPNGVRAQINFPSCWDGKNVDSPDHKSHVAFLSQGPDQGSCTDPKFPVTLPRIFIEVYWGTQDFNALRSSAKNSNQPFVFSYGDPTGAGYHADFYNGWDSGVLQRAVDGCHCNEYGDPTCCGQAGIFDFNPKGNQCHITPQVDEVVTGTLPKLPGDNPVQGPEDAVNGHVVQAEDPNPPQALYPPSAYTTTPDPNACAVPKLGANCHVGPVPGGSTTPASSVASSPSATSAPQAVPSASGTAPGAVSVHPAPGQPASAAPPSVKSPAPPSASAPSSSSSGGSSSGQHSSGSTSSGSTNSGSTSSGSNKSPSNPSSGSTSSGEDNSNDDDGDDNSGTCYAPAGKRRKAKKHANKRRRSIH